ncbi:hypothetical protein PtA15_11A320 [Puccinia triticina]|uniref:HCNGP-like protein n=1 Tax=Puccinia triticina TaxID=208348 RepID=A0ABY7D0T7_9BASI|nr:uncharacterized protein PtA15_11A320 [Puccinia triticina]WAQ89630.1 hypothetical protein PtA15_11A320 [Puccinia triticina]WAR59649.1 hypothetical protein PtB15_11B289 [Puccinia triticina]
MHPPEPVPPAIDPELINKITRFKALREQGIYFNDNLVQSKAYRNPNIYTKLVEFLDLRETTTNFAPSFWDPLGFPSSAYADALRQRQQSLADEKDKQRSSAAARTTIDFQHARAPASSSAPAPSKPPLKRDRERDRAPDRERDQRDRDRRRHPPAPSR